MIPLTILIFGLLLVLGISVVLLIASSMTPLVMWVISAVPLLVAIGSGLLILIELLLFFGNKEDRRIAGRDLGLLVPTCILSAAIWYGSAFVLGLWR